VNGALTAAVGLAAIEVCRPLPFLGREGPSVTGSWRGAEGLFGRDVGWAEPALHGAQRSQRRLPRLPAQARRRAQSIRWGRPTGPAAAPDASIATTAPQVRPVEQEVGAVVGPGAPSASDRPRKSCPCTSVPRAGAYAIAPRECLEEVGPFVPAPVREARRRPVARKDAPHWHGAPPRTARLGPARRGCRVRGLGPRSELPAGSPVIDGARGQEDGKVSPAPRPRAAACPRG
jgi:hypothetical protein